MIVNNPRVGENFQDHVTTGMAYEFVEGKKTMDILRDQNSLQGAINEYITTKGGPLSQGGALIGFASYASLATDSQLKQLQGSILTPHSHSHSQKVREVLAESYADPTSGNIPFVIIPVFLTINELAIQRQIFTPPEEMLGKNGITIGVAVEHPLSVGSVHIKNNDPTEDPAIDPAYLAHLADVEVCARGLELLDRIVNTSPFKEIVKRRYAPAGDLDFKNVEQVEKYVRKCVGTQYHPIGTVAMGDDGACDERLKVKGKKGLRVLDSSVIPLHLSGNIVATVYAIGEKGADLIKEDWAL